MKKRYKIKYSDSSQMIELNGYGIQDHIVALFYPDIAVNLNGFVLYDPEGNVLKDCSAYRYRYDVLEDNPNAIYYTDLEEVVQTEKWNHSDNTQIEEEPLTNEELTECVADLLYETSLMKLGMEG